MIIYIHITTVPALFKKTLVKKISDNNNARPERKRAPVHRYAVVEHRIHCETQYFWKHASIRSPKTYVKIIRKFTRAFAKILCFAGDSHRQELEISGFLRLSRPWKHSSGVSWQDGA